MIALPVLGLALVTCSEPKPIPDGPNVVVMVFDTTRADHLGFMGYERDTTPHLDRFVEGGTVFERAYTPTGTTAPAHASLFTSLYPIQNGIVKNGLVLDDKYHTMAEYFDNAGYNTEAVVSSFVLNERFGWKRGFHFYDAEFTEGGATVGTEEWEDFTIEEGFDRRANKTTDLVLERLENLTGSERPFFLFVHYFDPHSPYVPPSPYQNRFQPKKGADPAVEVPRMWYDGEIAYLDNHVNRLLDALNQPPLAEDTLIVLTADHGEGLMNHGYLMHGVTLHEEEIHVPLVLHWPGRVPAGKRVDTPVELVDVLPTVLTLAGLGGPAEHFEGRDLAPLMDGFVAAGERRQPIYLFRRLYEQPEVYGAPGEGFDPIRVEGVQYGLLDGDWKYILAPEEGKQLLFNLSDDPGEINNVVEKRPDIAGPMRDRLEAWVDKNQIENFSLGTISPEDKARLRALGYVD